jgi:hypothetical protein
MYFLGYFDKPLWTNSTSAAANPLGQGRGLRGDQWLSSVGLELKAKADCRFRHRSREGLFNLSFSRHSGGFHMTCISYGKT